MQADKGDTVLNHYFLEHSYRFVFDSNYNVSYWSPMFFYPVQNVMTYSDNLLGSAPIYWTIRFLYSPTLSYQLWYMIVMALNFFSMLFLLHKLRIQFLAQLIGAYTFAFALPRILQINHQQLLPHFYLPLSVYYLIRFTENKSIKNYTLFLLFLYLQILAGIYLGWFALLGLSIFCFILFYYKRVFSYLSRHRTKLLIIFFISIGFLVINYVSLYHYLSTKSHIGGRAFNEVDQMLPQFSSYFFAPDSTLGNFLFKQLIKSPPIPHEHYIYYGLIITSISIYSIYYLFIWLPKSFFSNQGYVVSFCISFIVLIVISFRFEGEFTFWKLVYNYIPGADSIRAVTRISSTIVFFSIISGLLSIRNLFIYKNVQYKNTIYGILLIILILENTYTKLSSFDAIEHRKSIESLRSIVLFHRCDLFYLSTNGKDYNLRIENSLISMWTSLEANIPTVNGYSGQVPKNYEEYLFVPKAEFNIEHWISQKRLRELGIKKYCRIERNLNRYEVIVLNYD